MDDGRTPYGNRREAGRLLADLLEPYRSRADLLVLALPRGGVPVGFEVARALQADFDVFVVRKLGFPGHEEYAMGAIASGGVQVMNPDLGTRVSPRAVKEVVERERAELVRREALYRGTRPPAPIRGRSVIVVDDGLATGSTMLAAVTALRAQEPRELVVAVPVGARETCQRLRREADDVVCAAMPEPFRAVGLWYRDFPQTTDEEVRELLAASRQDHAVSTH